VLMNRMETVLVNSPPRRWLQRWYEVPAMRRLGGLLPPGAHVLWRSAAAPDTAPSCFCATCERHGSTPSTSTRR
jgi:hypothetical protein